MNQNQSHNLSNLAGITTSQWVIACGLLILSIWNTSCNKQTDSDAIAIELFQEEKELNCLLEAMKDSISKEWDRTNHVLKANLPSDMPEEEQANMLKVRNAELIRMFQSYDAMGPDVHAIVDETEQFDNAIAARIVALRQKIHTTQSKTLSVLQDIRDRKGEDELRPLQEMRQSILNAHCP
jgi:hypothetical protein